jgi:hypothetical protein
LNGWQLPSLFMRSFRMNLIQFGDSVIRIRTFYLPWLMFHDFIMILRCFSISWYFMVVNETSVVVSILRYFVPKALAGRLQITAKKLGLSEAGPL